MMDPTIPRRLKQSLNDMTGDIDVSAEDLANARSVLTKAVEMCDLDEHPGVIVLLATVLFSVLGGAAQTMAEERGTDDAERFIIETNACVTRILIEMMVALNGLLPE